jgi:DNA replicative helicase MCM subunit Mcm2 (Cdc46/Mcm family)
LYKVIEFAKKPGRIPLTPAAKTTCTRLYLDIENNHLPGLAGKMTSRAAPHVRRLAMIYALLDMESVVDTKHLRAAKRLWDYCEDSAQFCFNKMTKKQLKLFRWIEKKQVPVTLAMIRDEFYQRNEKIDFVKSIVNSLVALGHIEQVGETYRPIPS